MIHDKVLKFHDLIICYHQFFHVKIKKQLELSVDLLHFLNNIKVILTLLTLNDVDFVPFSCIDYFHIVRNSKNLF